MASTATQVSDCFTTVGQTTVGRRSPVIVSICLVVATLGAYGRVCQNEFVNYDDKTYVTENPHVGAGLTLEGVGWAFTTLHAANWHPLTWLSLELDTQLFGTRAWGYHLTNLLLHALNTLFLFWVFFRMTIKIWSSALVAVLFALHPLHVESVAWVSERKDVLSTFFWLVTMLAYVRYVTRPSLGNYATVVIAFTLGLAAKPMLVTLPCVLLLLDYWPLGRWRIRDRGNWSWSSLFHSPFSFEALRRGLCTPVVQTLRRAARQAELITLQLGRGDRTFALGHLVFEKLPLFGLAFIVSLATLYAQGAGGAVRGTNRVTYVERLTNASVAYGRYIRKTFWPCELCVYYPFDLGTRFFREGVIAGVGFVCVCVLVLYQARRRPHLFVGWFWYVGTLVPVIGLVTVGSQGMADRYTYVPLIGLFVMIAWTSAEFVARRPSSRWVIVPVAAVVCAACAALTWLQVEKWHNSVSLWEQAVRVTRPNPISSLNLGEAYFSSGRPREAIQYLEYALRAGHRVHIWLAESHRDVGLQLMEAQAYADAERHFASALDYLNGSAPLYNLRGMALAKQGKSDDAIKAFAAAAQSDPTFAEAWYNSGTAFEAREQWGEASACFAKALTLEPENASYRAGLAHANENLER